MSTPQKTSAAAITSLTAGLLVLACVGLRWPPLLTMLLSTAAVVSGHFALAAIRKEPERLDGKAAAIIGLVIGYVGLVAWVIAVLLLIMGFLSLGGR